MTAESSKGGATRCVSDFAGLLNQDGPAIKQNRGRWGKMRPAAEAGDGDMIVGRKGIKAFLRLAKWTAVVGRIRAGLPAKKICGRWEMSRLEYKKWWQSLPPGKGNP